MANNERSAHLEQSIDGLLLGAAGKAELGSVTVWFAFQSVGGEGTTKQTVSDESGAFTFALPQTPLAKAVIGAEIQGAQPIDLEPNGEMLEPGDLVLIVDDSLPSHLRYAG